MTDFRQDLHEALDEPTFQSSALLKQAMTRLDEPRRGGSYTWQVVVAAILVIALVATFLVVRAHRETLSPAGSSGWLAADFPGMHSGFRAAAYDANRNCLWIITKQPPTLAVTHDIVTLNRVNLSDRTTSPSLLTMPANYYLTGSIAVDAHGKVWMSWSKFLIEYDPDTKGVKTFKFPAEASVARASGARTARVHPEGSGTDGNSVAMTIGPDGEIWLLVNSIYAVFGFNPASASWDRMVMVPLDPVYSSRLVAAGPGKLVMSGVVIVHALYGDSYISVIDTVSGKSTVLAPKIESFSLIDNNTAVFVEVTAKLGVFNLGKVDLTDGSTTRLVAQAPVNSFTTLVSFATDASGRVWFSMIGYWTVGIARLNPTTGAIKEFPFAFVKHPGTPEPVVNSCPSSGQSMPDRCFPQYADPSAAFGDPEIQQLVIDKHGNIWVITAQRGSLLPGQELTESAEMAPVAELVAAAAR